MAAAAEAHAGRVEAARSLVTVTAAEALASQLMDMARQACVGATLPTAIVHTGGACDEDSADTLASVCGVLSGTCHVALLNSTAAGQLLPAALAAITKNEGAHVPAAQCAAQLRAWLHAANNTEPDKPVLIVVPDAHTLGTSSAGLAQLVHALTSPVLEGAPISLVLGTAAAVSAPGTVAHGVPGLDAYTAARLDAVSVAVPVASTRGDDMLRALYLTPADVAPLCPVPSPGTWAYLMGRHAEAGGTAAGLSRLLRAFAALHFVGNAASQPPPSTPQWRAAHAKWSRAVCMLAAAPDAGTDAPMRLADVVGAAFAVGSRAHAPDDELAPLLAARAKALRQGAVDDAAVRSLVEAWRVEAARLTPDDTAFVRALDAVLEAAGAGQGPPSAVSMQGATRMASTPPKGAPAPASPPLNTPQALGAGATKASKRRRTDFYTSLMVPRQREEAELARRCSSGGGRSKCDGGGSRLGAAAADLLVRECTTHLLKDAHLQDPAWRAASTPAPSASAKSLRTLLEANPRDAMSSALLRPELHGAAPRVSSAGGKLVAVGACAAFQALRRCRVSTKRKERDVSAWFDDFAGAMGLTATEGAETARATLDEAQARLAQASWELVAVGAATPVVARGRGSGQRLGVGGEAGAGGGCASGLVVKCLL